MRAARPDTTKFKENELFSKLEAIVLEASPLFASALAVAATVLAAAVVVAVVVVVALICSCCRLYTSDIFSVKMSSKPKAVSSEQS